MINAALKMVDIKKSFPGVQALKGINIEAYAGEALALIGTNGAGKSTLMNILNGIIEHDEGEIFIDGKSVNIRSPLDAAENGIAFVQQEMTLMTKMSIADNLFLTTFPKKNRFIDYTKTEELCTKALARLGYNFSPNTLVQDLGAGDRQIIQITSALLREPRIIIFDEATSSLTNREKERLFEVIASLKKSNVTIIYITHMLDEVFKLCDRAVVLRNGETVGQGQIKDMTRDMLVQMMIGHKKTQTSRKAAFLEDGERKPEIFKVQGIRRRGILKDISFSIRSGEVVGLWGLLGSGRTELARSIVGLDPIDGGTVEILKNGKLTAVSPSKAHNDIGIITEDRRVDGLSLSMSVKENMSSANLKRLIGPVWPFINSNKEKKLCQEYIKRLEVKISEINQPIGTLSGGNQQKVIMARWLQKSPDIYILDEPTRGLDIGAKEDIYNIIEELSAKGAAILVIMSDLDEIMGVSHRYLVMRRGQIVAEMPGEIEKEKLMSAAAGAEEEAEVC